MDMERATVVIELTCCTRFSARRAPILIGGVAEEYGPSLGCSDYNLAEVSGVPLCGCQWSSAAGGQQCVS